MKYTSDIIYMTPTKQKLCRGCRTLIHDLRDHLLCNFPAGQENYIRGAQTPTET